MRHAPHRPSATVVVRESDLTGADVGPVGALLRAYLVRTEHEKAERRVTPPLVDGALPPAYRAEVEDPETAFARCRGVVADIEAAIAGVVVTRRVADGVMVERLWVDPAARGRGLGAALLDAAIDPRATTRLTVWDWRAPALGLYASRGFEVVASWESRERLVCLARHPRGGR